MLPIEVSCHADGRVPDTEAALFVKANVVRSTVQYHPTERDSNPASTTGTPSISRMRSVAGASEAAWPRKAMHAWAPTRRLLGGTDPLVAPRLKRQLLEHVDQHLAEPTPARARVDDDLHTRGTAPCEQPTLQAVWWPGGRRGVAGLRIRLPLTRPGPDSSGAAHARGYSRGY